MRVAITIAVLLVPGATLGADPDFPLAAPCGVEREAALGEPCVTAQGALKICEEPLFGSDREVALVLRNGTHEIQSWNTEVLGVAQGTFRTVVADLNGDGVDDIAVAALTGTSNGMGISYWTVCAADGSNLAFRTACVDVQDYGSLGYFTRHSDAPRCALLQTTWRRGTEAKRGEGLYLVGRWLRFEKTGFVADVSRPLISRRLLYGFEHKRTLSLSARKHYAWFRESGIRAVTCPDPLCQ